MLKNYKQAAMGIALIVAGICTAAFALRSPADATTTTEDASEVHHDEIVLPEVEIEPVPEEEFESEPEQFTTAPQQPVASEDPFLTEEQIVERNLKSHPVVDDAFFVVTDASRPNPPPFVQKVVAEAARPTKMMSPRDIAYFAKIQALFQAITATRNWEMPVTTVTRSGVLWKKTQAHILPNLTTAFVLFNKAEVPLLWARGNLVLDSTSQTSRYQKQKDKILGSILLPSRFPKTAETLGIGTSISATLHRKANRLFIKIPMKLVMVDGSPRADAVLMVTTTNGRDLPSLDLIIPMVMDSIQHTLITARVSRLLESDTFS